jgi:Fe-Mn family superoxide dismutase
MMTRRQAIKTTALASAALAVLPGALAQPNPAAPAAAPTGPFTLPPLPYAYDALEPHIDAQTMQIHHGRHHAAYVANLNKAIAEFPAMGKEPVEVLLMNLNSSVPETVRAAIRNQGGGHYNHSLFWQMMKKDGGGEPKAELAKAIETSFGNFASFKTKFTDAATKVFGSGWAWLVIEPDKRLSIVTTPNQDTPITRRDIAEALPDNSIPLPFPRIRLMATQVLLGFDVWEHAYYMKYQNKRADYITAWWNVVNWDFVAERYAKFHA